MLTMSVGTKPPVGPLQESGPTDDRRDVQLMHQHRAAGDGNEVVVNVTRRELILRSLDEHAGVLIVGLDSQPVVMPTSA